MDECGFRWEPKPGETITYTDGIKPATGTHCCIKHPSHVANITDDDHRCCCGNDTWSYDDE